MKRISSPSIFRLAVVAFALVGAVACGSSNGKASTTTVAPNGAPSTTVAASPASSAAPTTSAAPATTASDGSALKAALDQVDAELGGVDKNLSAADKSSATKDN